MGVFCLFCSFFFHTWCLVSFFNVARVLFSWSNGKLTTRKVAGAENINAVTVSLVALWCRTVLLEIVQFELCSSHRATHTPGDF